MKELQKRETLLNLVAKELDQYAQHKQNGTVEEYRHEEGTLEYAMELLAGMYKRATFEEEKEHAA